MQLAGSPFWVIFKYNNVAVGFYSIKNSAPPALQMARPFQKNGLGEQGTITVEKQG